MNPPTATAQMKQVRIVNGKPLFYDPASVKAARKLLTGHLILNRPEAPMEGAVALSALWLFPKGGNHKHGEWRVTKPNTSNTGKNSSPKVPATAATWVGKNGTWYSSANRASVVSQSAILVNPDRKNAMPTKMRAQSSDGACKWVRTR